MLVTAELTASDHTWKCTPIRIVYMCFKLLIIDKSRSMEMSIPITPVYKYAMCLKTVSSLKAVFKLATVGIILNKRIS